MGDLQVTMASPWVSMLKWSSMTQILWGYPGYLYDLGKPHQLVELVIQTARTSLHRFLMFSMLVELNINESVEMVDAPGK